MGETLYLDADFGYQDFRRTQIEDVVIDATNARWIVANIGSKTNKYPFLIDKSNRVVAIGGVIDGEVPLDLDWAEAYENSAAVFMRDTGNVVIRNWAISQAWDAIRVDGAGDNFRIEHVYLTDIRDDGVENDDGWNGTIRDSLFDGVFVGISLADGWSKPAQDHLVILENLLMRMELFSYKGRVTHGAMFKVEDTSPGLIIRNSVFAISDVDHAGQRRMKIAWGKVREASGNVLLNLTDTSLPPDYPLPPDGFEILEGAEARAYWERAAADWIRQNAAWLGAGAQQGAEPE